MQSIIEAFASASVQTRRTAISTASSLAFIPKTALEYASNMKNETWKLIVALKNRLSKLTSQIYNQPDEELENKSISSHVTSRKRRSSAG